MAFDPWTTPSARADQALAGDIARTDATTFMAKVYRWMALGLALTGLVAMGIAATPSARAIAWSPGVFLGCIVGELVLVLVFSRMVQRASFAVVAAMFVAYCVLNGITFSVIFLRYTNASIASTFFITGGAFGAMSVFGTITRKDLSSWTSFLMMGLFGVVAASVVNLFVRSDGLSFVLSCAMVVVFTGLTAWHTQKLRQLAQVGDDRLALSGALSLYLDFVNIFLALLNLFGRRR